MVMTIRTAVLADIPEMHRIRMSVRENRLLDPTRVRPEHYGPMLTERGRGWVADMDGRIAGFAIADRWRANIWALFVDPASEGRGLGRALHDAMMDWLFGAGVECAWLVTEPGTRAERFYREAGWRYVGPQHGEARYEMARRDWITRSGAAPGRSLPSDTIR